VDVQRFAAILLIASFVTTMLTTLVNAPGLYSTADIDARLRIIETHRTRWLISQALVILYNPLAIAGFGLLASTLRMEGKTWIPVFGAVAIVAGAIAAMYFVYLQTTDPRGGYSGAYPTAENLVYYLWLAGMLFFGIAFLQAGLPAWLGYLTAGTAIIYGVTFLRTGAGFMTPFLLAFLSLVIAIVLLRR
jgi:hypothetical protein